MKPNVPDPSKPCEICGEPGSDVMDHINADGEEVKEFIFGWFCGPCAEAEAMEHNLPYRDPPPRRLPPCEFRTKDSKCLIVDKTTTIRYPKTIVMYKSAARCRDAIMAEACKEGWA